GQRPEHEGVLENFRTRQDQAIEVADLLAIQQHVDIQRQTLSVRRIAAVIGLDEFQPAIQLQQRQLGFTDYHQIEEVAALDAHRVAFENRRAAHIGEQTRQRIEPGTQVSLALHIAAEAEKDPSHRHPRSISTPTPPRAAGTAPGLVSFSRTQGMLNSSIRSCTRRSAKVSTRMNCDSAAKAWIRVDTLA